MAVVVSVSGDSCQRIVLLPSPVRIFLPLRLRSGFQEQTGTSRSFQYESQLSISKRGDSKPGLCVIRCPMVSSSHWDCECASAVLSKLCQTRLEGEGEEEVIDATPLDRGCQYSMTWTKTLSKSMHLPKFSKRAVSARPLEPHALDLSRPIPFGDKSQWHPQTSLMRLSVLYWNHSPNSPTVLDVAQTANQAEGIIARMPHWRSSPAAPPLRNARV
ncbi:uncharacterized protein BKA78DRAFT_300683 [Phyllosticta capitalensis]|uniref:Uncharacterized protein n=1 Tax=Phyllosticta capitalensis TaxID=121624 RepID=A0ABR1Y8K3_9PEZI